ncbi:hypothetical protein EVAR_71621_1, partial [Eumeta japonica]
MHEWWQLYSAFGMHMPRRLSGHTMRG